MSKEYINYEAAGTIPGLFLERVKRSPDAVAFRQHDERTGEWYERTWRQVYKTTACWQAALENEGLNPGDRVAIMVRNSMEWVFFDQATLACGLVVVPVYLKESHVNIAHIMNDAGVRLLIIEDGEAWNGLAPIHGQLKTITRVLVVRRTNGGHPTGLVRYIDDWVCKDGDEVTVRGATPESAATIVYTSGTTGLPKGVELTHRAILYNAWAGLGTFDVFREDLFLSFLPLTHMFERTDGYYLPMMAGAPVCYARTVKTIAEDMLTQRPTLFITVPLVLQRVYEKVMGQAQKASPLKQSIFRFSLSVGWDRFEHSQGRGPWKPSFLLWPLLFALVGKKVLTGMGGRVSRIVCGGAPLAGDIFKFFVSLGINVQQGYGMTETSPTLSVNRASNNIMGSVGPALPGMELKIDPATGEVLAKTPSVMRGYWNNPEATRAIIDKDGWVHTGDVGELRNGHLFITDRLKQIIVMSNGEKVPPEGVEMAIRAVPLFNNVMVVGEKRPYLLLVAEVNAGLLEDYARSIDVSPDGGNHLRDGRLLSALIEQINQKLSAFPAYAKIKKLLLVTDVWGPDNGLTTSTLKMRRKPIMEKYSADIERLYAENKAK
ncbi:MAG: long-chain fatty acid--CoA ligase [Nitrospinae bacterium]|nr:long-chain fatty acid--CoA ligase [Nitrospinota bacterium]